MALRKDQIARYSRQLILPEIGVGGQQRLLDASALVIGAGGLGSPAAIYLAAAGVGTIGLVDSDAAELSNLHRQILHATQDVGRPKVDSGRDRLTALNPDVRVIARHERVLATTARDLVRDYDVVLDGSDNFPTRYIMNDACILESVPLIHGGVIRFEGQVTTIVPGRGACYRCLFGEPPVAGEVPNCQEAGVVGAMAGIVGCLMAHEALKLLLGIGEPLINRLLVIDGKTSRFREVPFRRDPACAVCGANPVIREPLPPAEACPSALPRAGGDAEEIQAWRTSKSP